MQQQSLSRCRYEKLKDKSINAHLQQKYQLAHDFYKSKQINQILCMDPVYPVYIDFCQSRCFSQQFEYLKRVYYYRNSTGKPQLESRLKMISQYYTKSPTLVSLAYEYPMMVITNTKSLFMRRKRRLRKIEAGEGSQDDTEEEQQEIQLFDYPSMEFLKDLNKSDIGEKSSFSSFISYESEVVDLYRNEIQPIQSEQENKINLNVNEDQLKSLIKDFGHLSDNTKHSADDKVSTQLPKNAFTNIENHSKQYKESISVFPIDQKLKFAPQAKRRGIFGNYVDQLLSNPISFSDLGLRSNKSIQNQTKQLPIASEPQSIANEREERANRRKKIREKAEELLQRVKNQ